MSERTVIVPCQDFDIDKLIATSSHNKRTAENCYKLRYEGKTLVLKGDEKLKFIERKLVYHPVRNHNKYITIHETDECLRKVLTQIKNKISLLYKGGCKDLCEGNTFVAESIGKNSGRSYPPLWKITSCCPLGNVGHVRCISIPTSRVDERLARIEENAFCVVCLENQKSRAIVPCGHFCLCFDCANPIEKTGHCPICRAAITSILTIYQ